MTGGTRSASVAIYGTLMAYAAGLCELRVFWARGLVRGPTFKNRATTARCPYELAPQCQLSHALPRYEPQACTPTLFLTRDLVQSEPQPT